MYVCSAGAWLTLPALPSEPPASPSGGTTARCCVAEVDGLAESRGRATPAASALSLPLSCWLPPQLCSRPPNWADPQMIRTKVFRENKHRRPLVGTPPRLGGDSVAWRILQRCPAIHYKVCSRQRLSPRTMGRLGCLSLALPAPRASALLSVGPALVPVEAVLECVCSREWGLCVTPVGAPGGAMPGRLES